MVLTVNSILVIGARNSGKTAFLDFLQRTLALPPHKHPSPLPDHEGHHHDHSDEDGYCSRYVESEFDGERVGLTLWDSDGLDGNLVDLQTRGIVGFLESKFEDTLMEEVRVVRSPQVRDTHIHCTFLLLDPVNLDRNIAVARKQGRSKVSDPRLVGILDEEMDVQVLRAIQGKTTVVPVISKADIVTTPHMAYLKMAVRDSLKKAKVDPLETLTLREKGEDEEEYDPEEWNDYDGRNGYASSHQEGGGGEGFSIPFSILSPDPETLESVGDEVGRRYPWGFADPFDDEHCDFVSLKETVFGEWRNELQAASREICYERWRTDRLDANNLSSDSRIITDATNGLHLSPGV